MNYPFSLIFIIVALPLLGAALVKRSSGPDHARQIGGVIAGAVLLALAYVLLDVVAQDGGGRVEDPALALGWFGVRPLFGFDALSAVLALTNAITAFAVIVGAPRSRDERPRITTLLATEGLILTMLASLDLVILALAFACLVSPAGAHGPSRREGPDTTRLYRAVFIAGALPLAAAVGLISFANLGSLGPDVFDLRVISMLPHRGASVVLGLLMLTVLVRMALLPLHSWLPAMTQHGPLGPTVLLVASQSGAYLFVRVAFVFFPGDAGGLTTWLTLGGVASALYGGVISLIQDDLRRLIGWLSVSQAGLMIIGLCSLESDGVAGAVVYWTSYGTAVTGLALTVWAVQARTGTTTIAQLGGLVESCPRLTVAFAAFAVASVGFPGSLGFVGEDLLIHGVLDSHPLLGVLMLVATALNGIALIRALFRVFLGPVKIAAPADLRARELWVVAGLAAVVFGLGLWPRLAVDVVGLARLCIHV
ncbi:proton-conducting transporter transmembrane domain-containing protein [Enhygromyxa salina]|uniref:NAD(P)H-quinone oxidoreductase chain 4 1 n=1 Tax=Enhygromyxa salina TaxID=215803 RepID=A0A2S9YYK0_9BACT|nr:proton-conducting transporter membrane subunit [Enhygromyxa salina]PRQ10139.1 NAD(P)H-quinone oxidoreductase chain 4 1 [Enhygromyxa salina]